LAETGQEVKLDWIVLTEVHSIHIRTCLDKLKKQLTSLLQKYEDVVNDKPGHCKKNIKTASNQRLLQGSAEVLLFLWHKNPK